MSIPETEQTKRELANIMEISVGQSKSKEKIQIKIELRTRSAIGRRNHSRLRKIQIRFTSTTLSTCNQVTVTERAQLLMSEIDNIL